MEELLENEEGEKEEVEELLGVVPTACGPDGADELVLAAFLEVVVVVAVVDGDDNDAPSLRLRCRDHRCSCALRRSAFATDSTRRGPVIFP